MDIQSIPTDIILFFILYGITGVVPLLAALYLLLRTKAYALVQDVAPPVRLRRWTASFFAVAALAHVWWLLFYIYSDDLNSVAYQVIVMFDCTLLFTSFAGMLLAMLQDRRRPVWPALLAMIPFLLLVVAHIIYPSQLLMLMAAGYLLLLGLLFTGYMVVAVRQYGRWLNDNYADLENKKVWLCQTVSLVCMLLFVLYVLAIDMVLIWIIHIIELILVGLLLWRVETLPRLSPLPLPVREGSEYSQGNNVTEGPSTPLNSCPPQTVVPVNIDLEFIEQMLIEHCVNTQLYLKHDLNLAQLAQAVGTNRYYLSQYFSRKGITYNIYINNQRINHFISRYDELTAAGQPIVAQQLAIESGYRSYSTFSLAFKQRTGQSVTDWMRESDE